LVEDLEIRFREADLVAQCREGITHANARLWLDGILQNLTDFGFGTVPMLSSPHPQSTVHIFGQITYCQHGHCGTS
jgi:hypothetical protein